MHAWFDVTTGLPSAASISATTASAGSAVHDTNSASASGLSASRAAATMRRASTRAMSRSSSIPRQRTATTSNPAASRCSTTGRVVSGRYGVSTAIRRTPSAASPRFAAPIGVTTGTPGRAAPIAAATASSPITTDADVQP